MKRHDETGQRPEKPAWTPRDWQARDAAAVRAALATHRRALYVAPQGAGKTVVGCLAIAGLGRALWLTPTRETALQAVATLRASGVACAFLLADAPGDDPDPTVFVGTVASARLRAAPRGVRTVVLDEAHHAPARTWTTMLARFPAAKLVGLTGSPWRLDGRPLRAHFDVLVPGPKPSDLVARGHLARPVVYTWPRELGLPTREGADYSGAARAGAAGKILVGDLYETWRARTRGWPTVAFACTVEHSRALAAEFAARGVASEHVDARMSTAARDAALARFRSGATTLLSTVGVLAEGWDMPEARCVIAARPMRSLALWLQQCGRVMRPGPRRLVLDHAGNALRLRHPADDRPWSLDGHASEAVRGQAVLVPCPACAAAIPPQCRACPECGHELDARERALLTKMVGELVPLHSLSDRQLWNYYVEHARLAGKYIHDAERKFRDATDREPDPAWYPEDKTGFGDLDILLNNARWLGRPRADAYRELAALRTAGEFLPQPRRRMPQGRPSVRRLVRLPKTVPLADAPGRAFEILRRSLLRALAEHGWNISAACKSVDLEYDAVHTYCKPEYEAAKAAGKVLRTAQRNKMAAMRAAGIGVETMAQAAKRHGVSPDTMRRALLRAGLLTAGPHNIFPVTTVDADRAMAAYPRPRVRRHGSSRDATA